MIRCIPLVSLVLAVTGIVRAQDLRKALADADLVVIGRQVGKRPAGDAVVLHRLQVVDGVRGHDRELPAVTVLDWPELSLHNRPQPRQQRLYCLADASATAARLGLPAAEGPFYKMVGWPGSNPLVGADLDRDPAVRLARLMAAADAGAPATATAAGLLDLALGDDAAIRLEAVRLLAERPHLRAHLSAVQWSALLARACGETADVDYKIALAELCAEQQLDGVAEALIVGLGSVPDPRYARAVGRLAAALHGDEAVRPLLARLQRHGEAEHRAALLLAIGATRTAPALDALLQLKRTTRDDAAIDAALREHRSRKALEAVLEGERGRDREGR